jgi:serine/threonine protein kinase
MVGPDGSPFLLDYELAWSFKTLEPTPPFGAVSPGYQAPERLNNPIPTIQEEIYACGALLFYLVTGLHPEKLLNSGHDKITAYLKSLSINSSVVKIITRCLDHNPGKRLPIPEMINMITACTNNMNFQNQTNQ